LYLEAGIDTILQPWFSLQNKKYDFPTVNWPDSVKILFTNILFRESTSYTSQKLKIDQYLVAIAAMRKFFDKKLTNVIQYKHYKLEKCSERQRKHAIDSNETHYIVPKFMGTFTMDSYEKPILKSKLDIDAWAHCYTLVGNVMEGNIPEWVPYIPHGTFAYLNIPISTDTWWIDRVQTKYIRVAHSYKQHTYFADPKYMTDEEKKLLQI
jgi:hypothetical protein